MKSGIKTIKRTHARNYSHETAQKRLDECVPAYNAQVLNALNVDYVPIYYYNILKLGVNCTCEKHDAAVTSSAEQAISSSDVRILDGSDYEIVGSDSYAAMFGDNSSHIDYEDEDDEDLHPIVTNESQIDSIFAGNNINCGICYRSGFLPGYSMQRGMRTVLTTYDIVEAQGYTIITDSPYVMKRVENSGFVEFVINVPKFYSRVAFSIRNNHDILRDSLFFNDEVLTLATLKQHCGKTIKLRIKSLQFTHAVLEFFFQADEIRANIPQLNKTLDYTMLETIGNVQAVLPMTIGVVSAGDHIAIPSRNIFLKVVDVENVNTAKMRQLEWKATCRVLQPQEALKKLSFNLPLK